ncbi:MAG: ABC transporter substrate-binding protein [Burkholderiaceae bacterium]
MNNSISAYGRVVRHLAALCAIALLSSAVWAQDIVVGQVGPFTGLPSPDATEVNQGAQAYFDLINERGGIGGRKITFFKLDDQFKGDEFAKQIDVAAQKKPIALITPIGSAAMQRAFKDNLFDKYDFVVVNAIPGADIFRKPGHPRLFHIRASDGQQITKIINHAKTVGINSVTVLHQDLPIGTAGLERAREIAVPLNVKIEGFQAKHDDTSLAEGARKVAQRAPESVLVIGSPKYMADAINQLRRAGVLNSIFALSYLPPGLVTKLAGEDNARGIGIAQTYPNPNGRTIGLQREFQETMKKYAPSVTNYSAFHLEGYISARVLVEALRRSGAVSADRVARALRSIDGLDLGGFVVDFSSGNTGSSYVDIAVVTKGGRLMY